MATVTELGIKGKLKGAIFYIMHGKQRYRSKPSKMTNPRTPEQMQGRTQFGAVSKFASTLIKDLIHPYWNPLADKINRRGYNYFVTSNLPAFKSGELAADKLILCLENGLVGEEIMVEKQGKLTSLRWEYNRPEAKSSGSNDALCLLILSQAQGLRMADNIARRSDRQVIIEHTGEGKQHYFAFWKRGKLWSASNWLFEVNPDS